MGGRAGLAGCCAISSSLAPKWHKWPIVDGKATNRLEYLSKENKVNNTLTRMTCYPTFEAFYWRCQIIEI